MSDTARVQSPANGSFWKEPAPSVLVDRYALCVSSKRAINSGRRSFMPDETSDGGFEPMRIIVNLGGVVLVGGLVVLIVATIIAGLD